jgi:hypothetical protein
VPHFTSLFVAGRDAGRQAINPPGNNFAVKIDFTTAFLQACRISGSAPSQDREAAILRDGTYVDGTPWSIVNVIRLVTH